MNGEHLKLRTAIAVAVIAVFALSIHPLTPRNFYDTFRSTLKKGAEGRAETLIAEAQKKQEGRPDIYPSVALLEAADGENVELKELVDGSGLIDNSDVIGMIRKKAASSIRLGLDLNGGVEFMLNIKPDPEALAAGGESRADIERKMETNFDRYRDLAMEGLRKRLETQNIFESEITPFGKHGLSLKAPVVSKDEKEKLRNLIKMSCKLQFRLVHPRSRELLAGYQPGGDFIPPAGYDIMPENVRQGKETAQLYHLVARRAEMDGSGIEEAMAVKDEFGQIKIALHFNQQGGERFGAVTSANVGRQLAIVLDGKLYCAPSIQNAITGGRAEISGDFSSEDARNIADALTSGSFPFQIDITAVYDTDPTLGADNVRNGIWAGLMALALLAAFMIIYYRRAGVIAVVALAVNVILILGAMAAMGATMTMPGIAGIILTMGMAVDANVLIFERMREELEQGKNLASALPLGYDRAFSAVLDSNLTTLLTSIILMYFGTGPVKGFAVSLSIGIVSSMFTALFLTRLIFDYFMKYRSWNKLSMLRFFAKPSINFLQQSRVMLVVSAVAVVFSIVICFARGERMLAVDFTGGTLLSFNYKENVPVDQLERTLLASGIPGKVTYKSNAAAADNRKMEILIRRGNEAAGAESALQQQISTLLTSKFPQLDLQNGQLTSVGGMVGGEMSKSAVTALILALIGMTIYITIRYELVFAAAGMAALIHDAIVSLGIFVLMGRELSLPVVAGILTVIGYSINDTIVIFDRIREERRLFPDMSFPEVVNDSLNRTLSRTVLTSLTTFLVVIIMFLFGGIAINDFILIMMLGIIAGTYSSLYIAGPLVVTWMNFRKSR